jgi:GntR family transcriptional regulator of arabinose operon
MSKTALSPRTRAGDSRALSKYRALASRLRKQIVQGRLRPGERLPSFPQMHRDWGVTQKTVEQAYQLLEKEGLIWRRSGSGVYVSDATQPAATGIIAVANDFPAQHPYFIHLLNGVQDAARARKTEVLLLHDNSLIAWEKVDGVLSCVPYPEQFLCRLPHGMPHVSLLHPLTDAPSVTADDRAAMQSAVQYLVDLGHRRIGYISLAHLLDEGLEPARYAGYLDGLKAVGIKPNSKWLRPCKLTHPVEYDMRKFGHHEMQRWLGEDWDKVGCTAVLAHNDDAALGILDALQEAGRRVPEEVSVVGFDGLGVRHPWCGTITSMGVPLYEIGVKGTEVLIEWIRQSIAAPGREPRRMVLPATLQPGDSTAEAKT